MISNRLFTHRKLNHRGFSHHFLVPLLVILMVAAVGIYVYNRSRAATEPSVITYTYHRGDFGVAPGAGLFVNDQNGGAYRKTAFDTYKDLGVRVIRSTIPWKSFETSAGYDWRSVDSFIMAANQYKDTAVPAQPLFRYIITIESPPTKYGPTTTSGCSQDNNVPFNLDAYARASGALAKHLLIDGVTTGTDQNGYKNLNGTKAPTANVFELENSPNISSLSGDTGGTGDGIWAHPNPCAYTQLLKKSHLAIHNAVDSKVPNVKVLVGGIGGVRYYPAAGYTEADCIANSSKCARIPADQFLAGIYKNNGESSAGLFDGVSYHPYSSPVLPCAASAEICVRDGDLTHTNGAKYPYGVRNGWNRMLMARKIMQDHGDCDAHINGVIDETQKCSKRIWATEFGGPSLPQGISTCDKQYLVEDGVTPAGADCVNHVNQVTLLTAGYQRASQYPWLGPLCWFTYQDEGLNYKTDPTGDWMGLLRKNSTHKPIYNTYKALSDLVSVKSAGASADAEF